MAELVEVSIDFDGDAEQAFHVGAASCGTYGSPAGVAAAIETWGSMPLAELAGPAAALARAGAVVTPAQAYLFALLAPIVATSPEGSATFLPGGRPPAEGERFALPEMGDAIERLGREGAAPFYTGDIAAAIVAWVADRGGLLTMEDLAAYEAVPRRPARVAYRGHEVLTNPPPSAGGTLLALALGLLDRAPGPPSVHAIVDAMAAAQEARTDAFLEGLAEPGFLERFLQSRLGGPRTSRRSTAPAAAPRSRARTARAPAWWCRAPGSTSTTSWARRTSAPSASTPRRPGGGCRR